MRACYVGIALVLLGTTGCSMREPSVEDAYEQEEASMSPPAPEDMIGEADKAATKEPPMLDPPTEVIDQRVSWSVDEILERPSRLVGQTFRHPESPIPGTRSPWVVVDHRFLSRWANDQVFVAWIGEPIADPGSSRPRSANHRVLDALAFRTPQSPEHLVILADIGYGCYLETADGVSGSVVARAQYSSGFWDENSCEQEDAETVVEAWWADIAAGQFVPVDDLSRVRCYRGACP